MTSITHQRYATTLVIKNTSEKIQRDFQSKNQRHLSETHTERINGRQRDCVRNVKCPTMLGRLESPERHGSPDNITTPHQQHYISTTLKLTNQVKRHSGPIK